MNGLKVNQNKRLREELYKYELELKRRVYKNDAIKWINDFCKIRLEGGGIGEFILRDYQQEFVSLCLNTKKRKVVALKSRQMGFSWTNAALMLYLAIYNEEVDLLIMSKNEKEAILQLGRIKFMLRHLPVEYKLKTTTDNATQMSFKNGTNIYSLTSGEDSGRSYTSFFTLWDEAAFSQYDSEIKRAIEPATQKGTLVVQSTPKGMGNEFHNMWLDDRFDKFECSWRRHEERDEAWATANGWKSEKKHIRMSFDQEFGCSFEGSSMNVFDLDIVKELKELKEEPIETLYGGLKVYRKPVKGEKYGMGVDVAVGLIRGDYSTIAVMAKSTNEVVAVFRERFQFDDFTKVIIQTSKMYNKALVAVEKNNHGNVILENLKRTRVPMYYRKKYDNYYKKWTSSVGWLTTAQSKPIAIHELEEQVRNKEIGILDEHIFEELSSYIYEESGNREKMNAMGNSHDDLVIAVAICIQCMKDVRSASFNKVKPKETFVSYRNMPSYLLDMPKKEKSRKRFIKTCYF